MATTQAAGADAPLSAETVWALFKETDARMDRRSEEADKRFKELERALKEIEKVVKEVAEQQKETDRQIGRLGNWFGEMVEHMVIPNLVDKFRKLGFVFTNAYPGAILKDEKSQFMAEIDITLENGDKVMIVEMKTKPTTEDVNDHVQRMKKARRYADLHGGPRKYRGAVAGMVVNEDVRDYILGKGFYAIEPSDDTFNIIEPTGKYRPREW
jgi:hypothetical protein